MSASSSRDGVACTAEAEAHAPLLEGHAEREALAELLVHGAEGHCRVLAQDRRSVCVAKGDSVRVSEAAIEALPTSALAGRPRSSLHLRLRDMLFPPRVSLAALVPGYHSLPDEHLRGQAQVPRW